MDSRFSAKDDFVTLISSSRPVYGQQIAILGKPTKQNGHWVANAMLSSAALEEVFLNTDQLRGDHYVVLRSEDSGDKFSSVIVSADAIDRATEGIERNIANLLFAPLTILFN